MLSIWLTIACNTPEPVEVPPVQSRLNLEPTTLVLQLLRRIRKHLQTILSSCDGEQTVHQRSDGESIKGGKVPWRMD